MVACHSSWMYFFGSHGLFFLFYNCTVRDRIEPAWMDSSQPASVRRLHSAACIRRFAGVSISPFSCRFTVCLQCHWQSKCSTSPNTFPRLSLLSSVNVSAMARCSAAESSVKAYFILHSKPKFLIQWQISNIAAAIICHFHCREVLQHMVSMSCGRPPSGTPHVKSLNCRWVVLCVESKEWCILVWQESWGGDLTPTQCHWTTYQLSSWLLIAGIAYPISGNSPLLVWALLPSWPFSLNDEDRLL